MKRMVFQIRDLALIEKELSGTKFGVLAVRGQDDEFLQMALSFLYVDKNIFVFFSESDEMMEKILFDTPVNFTIIRDQNTNRISKIDFEPGYELFSITIKGIIRKIDDVKLISDLQSNYLKKYLKKDPSSEINFSPIGNAVLIDTEEIQAIEEFGG